MPAPDCWRARGKLMQCPHCQAASSVSDSRPRQGTIRRVRRCKACGFRFVTWETTASPDAMAETAAALRDMARQIEQLDQPQLPQPPQPLRPRLVPPTEAAA